MASPASLGRPLFWSNPIRFIRWSSVERSTYFWSVVIGAMGPISLVAVPPIRQYFGDVSPAPIPLTYPIPSGPRKQLAGYGDDTEK